MNKFLLLSTLFVVLLKSSLGEDVEYCADKTEDYNDICHAADSEPCPVDNSTLDVCCHCFDICCHHDGDQDDANVTVNDSFNVTVIVPLVRLQNEAKSNRTLIGTINGGLGGITGAVGGAVSGTLDYVGDLIRVRRSGASKTSRGTGEDVPDETEDPNAGQNRSLFGDRKELEAAIGTAVRIALNKLAHTLKNVTESEEPQPDYNATSTTISPPVESCSSKSKRCEEQEPDLLDEFFPPKSGGRGRGKRRRRREHSKLESYNFRTLEMKKGTDFGSSGGLITKGEVQISNSSRNFPRKNMTHSIMMTTTEDPMNVTSTELENQNHTGMSYANMTRNGTQPVQGNSRGESTFENKTEEHEMSTARPSLVTSSLLVPKVKPGKCENITMLANKTCIALQPDTAQCTLDTECEGTRKCCFYGCKPYDKIGICSVPVFY